MAVTRYRVPLEGVLAVFAGYGSICCCARSSPQSKNICLKRRTAQLLDDTKRELVPISNSSPYGMLHRDHYRVVSSGLSNESLQAEEARIRAAYARRQGDDVRYSWFSPGHLFMVQEREREMLALLKQHGFGALSTKKILEIGCGAGYWLREFIKWGARPENIIGIDLLPGLVAEAKQLCPSAVKIECESAAELAFPDGDI